MEEKLEKQEDIELCEHCNYVYKPKDDTDYPCPECGEYGKKYATKITFSKIYIK